MNKFVTEMETDDFGLSDTGTDYAKIFTTYTNIGGLNQYNDVQIMFRVLHLSSSSGLLKPKDFIMTFNKDGSDLITFRDLDPEEKNLSVVYTVDANGKVDVYAKGYIIGAKIKIQVLYCTSIAFFTFYNNAVFNNTPSNTVSPTNFIEIYSDKQELSLQNGWVRDTYSYSYYHRKGFTVWVNLLVYNGTYTADTVISHLPYDPQNDIFIPCVCYDSGGNCAAGLLRLLTNGEIRVVKLPNNNTVAACFSYPIIL